MKHLFAIALVTGVTCASSALAQPAASAPASTAKKEMVQRLLALQQTALDSTARGLVERPARQMMAAADNVMQTAVAPEKRAAATAQIQSLMRKYAEEALPVARERATKLGNATLAPLFEEKFSEDELRQLLAALDAPAYKKYQQALPELSNAFLQKLMAELEPLIEPKLKALEQDVGTALGVSNPAAAAAPKQAKPAAAAASKPAKK